MAYISYSKNGDNPLTQLLGHNADLLKSWMQLHQTFYEKCSFDPLLQEEVRKAVAYQIGCAYCMSHGCPAPLIEDPKTKAAVAFAKKVSQTHLPMTEEDISTLKLHFTEEEIAELCAFICYGVGFARFGHTLGVGPKNG